MLIINYNTIFVITHFTPKVIITIILNYACPLSKRLLKDCETSNYNSFNLTYPKNRDSPNLGNKMRSYCLFKSNFKQPEQYLFTLSNPRIRRAYVCSRFPRLHHLSNSEKFVFLLNHQDTNIIYQTALYVLKASQLRLSFLLPSV